MHKGRIGQHAHEPSLTISSSRTGLGYEALMVKQSRHVVELLKHSGMVDDVKPLETTGKVTLSGSITFTSINFDVQSTVVEVREISLLNMMVEYRTLISGRELDMNHDEIIKLLDNMIDDADQLSWHRPVLSLNSARGQILNSKSTRYNIKGESTGDPDEQFRRKRFLKSSGRYLAS